MRSFQNMFVRKTLFLLFAVSSTALFGMSVLWAIASSDDSKHKRPTSTRKLTSGQSEVTPRDIRNTDSHYRVSDALLIGVSKCGSEALMFFVGLQTQVFPLMQEIEYLCDGVNYQKGLDFYYDKLPKNVPANQLIFERDGSCWRRDQYPRRVYETYRSLNKTIKIVAVVCDPAYRVQSWYIHGTNNDRFGLTYGRYDAGFDKVAFNPDGSVNTDYDGIRAATYDERFAQWLKYFHRQHIHVIDGELLKRDPYQVIHDLETFLGVDHLVTRDNFFFNETKGYFCKVKNSPAGAVKCMSSSKGRYHPEIDPALTQKLFDYFKPHNDKFEELTGQKFIWNRY